MSAPERDATTAAAIILLLGAVDALERGEVVAVKVVSDDDNDDGRWRIALDLAEPAAGEGDVEGEGEGEGIERLPVSQPLLSCPLCRLAAYDVSAKACRSCDFRDD